MIPCHPNKPTRNPAMHESVQDALAIVALFTITFAVLAI